MMSPLARDSYVALDGPAAVGRRLGDMMSSETQAAVPGAAGAGRHDRDLREGVSVPLQFQLIGAAVLLGARADSQHGAYAAPHLESST